LGELLVVVVVDVDVFPRSESEFTVVVSDFEADDGSLTTVVFDSFFSAVGLVTVVSFCSQAASKAAPARIQRILFIVVFGRTRVEIFYRSLMFSGSAT